MTSQWYNPAAWGWCQARGFVSLLQRCWAGTRCLGWAVTCRPWLVGTDWAIGSVDGVVSLFWILDWHGSVWLGFVWIALICGLVCWLVGCLYSESNPRYTRGWQVFHTQSPVNQPVIVTWLTKLCTYFEWNEGPLTSTLSSPCSHGLMSL